MSANLATYLARHIEEHAARYGVDPILVFETTDESPIGWTSLAHRLGIYEANGDPYHVDDHTIELVRLMIDPDALEASFGVHELAGGAPFREGGGPEGVTSTSSHPSDGAVQTANLPPRCLGAPVSRPVPSPLTRARRVLASTEFWWGVVAAESLAAVALVVLWRWVR